MAGIKYSRIEGDGLQWPCPNVEHPGTPFLHKDGKFTRGKGLFTVADWTPPAEVADEEYPFVLSTGTKAVPLPYADPDGPLRHGCHPSRGNR